MAQFSFHSKKFQIYIGVLFIITSIVVLSNPITLHPDSYGYIEMYFNRTPVYPLFVGFVKAIFGNYFQPALKVLQLGIGLYAIWFFILQLRKHISLQTLWYLILTAILIIPYVYNHRIANNVLTEAIAYPLYLLTTIHFIIFFFKERTKHLGYGLVFLFILLLTRKQFLYFVPIGIAILLWIGFKSKTFKRHIPYLITLVLLPFLVSLTDSTYHKIVHEHFTNTPWTGIHLLAPAMYVADKEDASIYTSEEEKIYFNAIFSEIEQNKYNKEAAVSNGEDIISHYISNFARIANSTIYPIGKELYEPDLSEDDALIKIDKTTTAMALPLILDNFKAWSAIYIKNFIYGFENSKYVLLYIILFLFGLSKLNTQKTNVYKAIAFVTCITLSNMAIVAIGMHTLKRFTFYNDWVLFFIIFILLNVISKKYLSTNESISI